MHTGYNSKIREKSLAIPALLYNKGDNPGKPL